MAPSFRARVPLVLTALLVVAILSVGVVAVAAAPPRGDAPRMVSTDGRLFNGVSLVKNISVGKGPEGIAFDPSNGNLYVANNHAGTVSVIAGSTNTVKATIKVGLNDTQVLYNPTSTELYVLNQLSKNVSVISGSTNKLVATLALAGVPITSVYDPSNGNVYVLYSSPGTASENVTMINHSTHSATKIKVGYGGDIYAAYDPATTDVVVADGSAHDLSVINSSTNKVTTVALVSALDPGSMTYNPSNKDLYVLSPGTFFPKLTTGNASALGPKNTIVATVKVGYYPVSSIYDPANHAIYVVDAGDLLLKNPPSNVTAIPSTNTGAKNIPVGKGAYLAAYDPANKLIYVPNSNSNTTSVINGSTNKVVKSLATPGSGAVPFVDPNGNSILIVANLGTGKTDKVYVFSTANVLTGTLVTGKNPGGAAYDSSNKDIYISNTDSNTVTAVH